MGAGPTPQGAVHLLLSIGHGIQVHIADTGNIRCLRDPACFRAIGKGEDIAALYQNLLVFIIEDRRRLESVEKLPFPVKPVITAN